MRRSNRSPRRGKASPKRLSGRLRGERLEPRALLTTITSGQKDAILAAFDSLDEFGDRLDLNGSLAASVPMVGATFGEIVDLGGRFKADLAVAVQGYFTGDASPTVGELKTHLGGLAQFSGVSSTVAGTTTRIDFTYSHSQTVSRTLSSTGLDAVADLGLSFGATQAVDLQATIDARLGFTFDDANQVSFRIGDLDVGVATAASAGTGLDAIGRLGFLNVSVTDATVSLQAVAGTSLSADKVIAAADLTATGDPDVAFDLSGSLTAALPLAASIGGYGTTAGSLPTISLASTSLFDDLGTVVTTNAAFADIAGFGLYSAGEMLGTIQDVGSLLGRIAGRPELATPIPFSSQTIGGLLDLSKAFQAELLGKVSKEVTDGEQTQTVADFATAADLFVKLPTTVVGGVSKAPAVTYAATTRELAYTVTLAHAFDFDAATKDVRDSFKTPVTFDLDLRPFTDLATTAQLSISLDAGITLTFGVDLDVEATARVSTEPGKTPGKLSAAATFLVSVDGAAAVPVVLGTSATDYATDLGGLVDDLNQALFDAGLSTSLVAEREADSTRITIRQTDLGTRFRIAAADTDPFVTDLGFAPQSLGRATVGDAFLDDTAITAKAVISAASVPITAGRFGFVDISLTPTDDGPTGTITGSADVTIGLKNPGVSPTDTGRVTVAQAKAAVLGEVADFARLTVPTVAGSAKAEFKGIGLLSDLAGLALTKTASLAVSLPTFGVGSQSIGTATLAGQFDLGSGKVADDIRFTLKASDGAIASVALTQGAPHQPGSLSGNASIANLVTDLNWAIGEAGLGDKVEAFAAGTSLQLRGRGTYGTPIATDFTTIAYTDFGDLKNFRDMKFSQIVGVMRSAATVLSRYESFGFLAQDLPLAGVSVIDLLGYAADYSAKVEQIAANPAGSVKQAERVINDALGTKPGDLGYVQLQWDAANKSIKIPFVLAKQLTEQRDLLIDIAKLAQASGDEDVQALLAGVDKLFDVSAAAKMTASTGYTLGVSLGIDLTDPSSPGTFLYTDQPLLAGNVGLRADTINLQAALGAVGVYVRGGSAALDSDGDPKTTNDPATFGFRLVGDGSNKLTFGAIDDAILAGTLSSRITPAISAGVGVSLPLYGPSATTKIGDMSAKIPSLVDFFKKLDPVSFPGFQIPNFELKAPDLASLFKFNLGVLDLLRDPTILVDGLDTALSAVQAGLKLTVFNKSFPVVGTALAEQTNFIDGFKERLLEDLRSTFAGVNGYDELRQVMFDALGPAGLGLLLDSNDAGSDVSINDITVNEIDIPAYTLAGPDRVTFGLKLGQSDLIGSGVKFDLGLPGLGFDMNAGVSLKTGWSYSFGFGLDVREGFFLDTSPDQDLAVTVNASVAANNVLAKLGFLQARADSINNAINGFNGTFAIRITDPGNDGRLSFADLASPAFSAAGLFRTEIAATAGVNLRLVVSADGSTVVPRLLTDLKAEWTYSSLKPNGDPKIGFSSVKLDVGSLATNFVSPIVTKIKNVLQPTRQLLHKSEGFLRQPMPVLSQLLGRNVSFLEFGIAASGRNYAEIKPFLDAYDFVMDFSPPANDGNLVVDLGSFNLPDISAPNASVKNIDVGGLSRVTVDPSTWSPGSRSAASSMTRSSGFTFVVPMLQDGGWKDAFKLLLGQDVDLFRFDMNVLSLNFNYRQFFPILGPIGTTLNGSLSIRAGFTFGFDTTGLRQFDVTNDVVDMFNGFYVKADGTSQIVVNGGIAAGVSVDLGFAKGGVEGGVFATVGMALRDLNNDGRLRLNEIEALIDEGPECLFRLSGKVEAKLYAWYEVNLLVTKITGQKDIVKIPPLVSFTAEADCNPAPVLARNDGGTLFLHMGTRAGDRQKGNRDDGAEKFVVEHVSGTAGNETVRVRAFGFTQEYSGVSRILFDAGNGNDSVDCRGVKSRVEGTGGDGDDTIYLGDGGGQMWGNSGRDVLAGGKGNDELDGGDGDDTLSGGEGDDTFRDESGTNTLDGGSGSELLEIAGTGADDTLRFWADRVERVGAFTNTITGIETVRASGGGGADRFEIDTSIAAKGGPVGSLALTTLDLRGDDGADQFLVFGTRSGSATTLAGGNHDDRFTVGNKGNTLGGKSAGSLDRIYGAVSIDAGSGANQLLLDDSGGWGDLGIVVESGAVTGLAPARVTFAATGGAFTSGETSRGVRILGSASKADIFAVRSTAEGNTTRVEGGGGNDLFTVGSTAATLDDIRGRLTIVGGAHDSKPVTSFSIAGQSGSLAVGDTLVIDDTGNGASGTSYDITSTSIDRTGAARILYESSETIDVRMGSQAQTAVVRSTADSTTLLLKGNDAANTFTVESTGTGSYSQLLSRGGDDAIVLANPARTVDEIRGTLDIDAGSGSANTLLLDDSGATAANAAAVLTADTITGVAGGAVRYTATEGHFTKTTTVAGTPAANDGIVVRNTPFKDSFTVRSTRAGSTTRVEGMGESDSFVVSSAEANADDVSSLLPSLDGIAGPLTIVGGGHDSSAQTTLLSQDRSKALATGDTLLVADQGDATAGMAYAVTPTTVDRTGAARITYVSTETLTLRTSRMGSTTEVTDTVAGGTTYVIGNAGIDRIDILSTGTAANLEVSGAGAADLVHLRTTGDDSFTRILGGAADDRIVLSSTAGTGSLAAPNFSADGNVGVVRGVVSIDAEAGSGNRLVIDDSTSAGNADVVVTNNRITGLAAGEIHYAATGGGFTNAGRNDGILLRGSATGRDVFLVRSTLLGTTTKIETYGGDDAVNVGSTSGVDRGDFDLIQGLLTLDTGDGTDVVHANDRGAGYDALRVGGQPKPLNNAATQSDAVTFDDTAKFNYRLDATSLRNDIFSPKPQDTRLGLIGGLSRSFAGVDYVGASLERFELAGTDNVNVFNVLPSPTTTFFVDGKLPVSGTAVFGGGDYLMLDTTGTSGRKIGIETVGQGSWTFTSAHRPMQFTSIERFNHVDIVAVSRENTTPSIDVYDAETLEYKFGIMPYESTFRGGARVATGDVNNDGLPDVVVVPGLGRPAEVRIFDGTPDAAGAYAAARINAFSAFAPGFAAGGFVALGDVNRDGANDIVAGADGGGMVRVFRNTTTTYTAANPATLAAFAMFDAFERTFRGGARVAAGDLNGDGFADVVVGRGPGGAPEVRVFSGNGGLSTNRQINSFLALVNSHRGGVNVGVGDYNGDGVRDVIVAADAGGMPTVSVFDGRRVARRDRLDLRTVLWTDQVYATNFRGGVSIATRPVAGPVSEASGGDIGFVQKVSIWTAAASKNGLRLGVLAHDFTAPSSRPRVTRQAISRGVHVDGNRLG